MGLMMIFGKEILRKIKSSSSSLLGRCADNQNGNLRWYLPWRGDWISINLTDFFCFPPPKYHPKPQSFFLALFPPSKKTKLQMQIQTQKIIFKWQTQRQKRWLLIFPSGADYQSDALLFIFPKVQMCKCDDMTFFCNAFFPLPWPKYFSCKVDNAFFHCHGKNIFSIAFTNVPRRSLSSRYQQSTFTRVLKWWGLTSLYILSLFDATSVTMHLLICC